MDRMSTLADERRVVTVEGAYNVRDLGGYATKDGRMTRWGVFFRGDGLHRLSAESRSALVNRGVSIVIDLRHSKELAEKRNVFAESDQVDYCHISLLNPSAAGAPQIRSLGDLYINLLEGSKEELQQVFRRLADRTGKAALFHCAAGKDRTGVVAALLLDLAGVSHEIITEDYALTATCIAPLMDELRSGKPSEVSVDQYELFLGCEPAYILDMLRHLEDAYGGSESYMQSIGLSESEIRSLKGKLVDSGFGC